MNPHLIAATPLLLWATIAILQLVGRALIRSGPDWSAGYRWLKTVLATIGTLAVAVRFTGVADTRAYAYTFLAALAVASAVECRYIIRSNVRGPHLRVKTRRGLAEVRSDEEARLIVSQACGIIRHDRLGTRRTLDERALVEMREALGLPSASEWETGVRRQMRERRERLARDRIFAADIAILAEEMRANDGR